MIKILVLMAFLNGSYGWPGIELIPGTPSYYGMDPEPTAGV